MNMSDDGIQTRPAQAGDAGAVTALMYSASPRLYDFIYQTAQSSALDYIAYEFSSGRGFCGHRAISVGVVDGRVVATASYYDAAQEHWLTLGTIGNVIRYFGPLRAWPVLLRARHTGSVMKPPDRGEWYLANFGVHPDFRGRGLGSRLLKREIARARQSGVRAIVLDVDRTNPGAEALYARLGFQVVRDEVFSGRRPGIEVPDSRRMRLDLKAAP